MLTNSSHSFYSHHPKEFHNVPMYPLREFDKKCRNFFIIIHSQYNNIGKNETADLTIITKKKKTIIIKFFHFNFFKKRKKRKYHSLTSFHTRGSFFTRFTHVSHPFRGWKGNRMVCRPIRGIMPYRSSSF